ncbi:patatin-like phospholipase family protein [Kordiimonas marina]|uniref:patatin-like phospholipase family protein n=1 Tax=Kordiimonas marina TaxID=2872312 RepID=UPI001FF6B8DB|nr:patatin-like phospholipase family protein [Kordiimonas marina]MCJ9427444.1 patatin-like phospholipase family protein [Kordiimonas marina]
MASDSEQSSNEDTQTHRPATRRPKVGLALGAGVARGWAHIGVLRRMQEEGIPVDMIAGTSIGAVVGGAYACGALDEVEDWARGLKEFNFFRFLDVRLSGGLFGSDRLNQLMRDRFGNLDFEDLNIPFTAVACELKTGHEIWLDEGPVSNAIRASFALPGVFEPCKVDGRWLVDGALVNPVPVSVCRAAGCEVVIAVNLAEDLYGRARARVSGALSSDDYGVFAESGAEGLLEKRGNASFFRKILGHKKDAPSLFSNMVASLNIMQNRLSRSRLAGDPPDVTITPRCGHIGVMEFHRSEELIDEGKAAFDLKLHHLKDALAIVTHRINI